MKYKRYFYTVIPYTVYSIHKHNTDKHNTECTSTKWSVFSFHNRLKSCIKTQIITDTHTHWLIFYIISAVDSLILLYLSPPHFLFLFPAQCWCFSTHTQWAQRKFMDLWAAARTRAKSQSVSLFKKWSLVMEVCVRQCQLHRARSRTPCSSLDRIYLGPTVS